MKFLKLMICAFFLSQVPQTTWAEVSFVPESTSQKCHAQEDFNFGVLVYNPFYKIYRSTGLGEKGLFALQDHLSKNHLDYPGRIIYLNHYGYSNNFQSWWDITREGVQDLFQRAREKVTPVYIIGNFAEEEEILSRPQTQSSLAFNFEFLHGGNRNVYMLGKNPLTESKKEEIFSSGDGKSVTRSGGRDAIYQVLKEILLAETPVHFHCKGGIHRTGMVGMLIRHLQGGYWINVKPPEEWQKVHVTWFGVPTIEEVDIRNLAEFEYIHHNPNRIRPENLEAVRTLVQEPLFQCLKEKFSYYLNYASDPAVDCYPREMQAERSRKALNKAELWNQCISQNPLRL